MTRSLLLLALVSPALCGCLKKYAPTDANRAPLARGSAEVANGQAPRVTPPSPPVPTGVDPAAPLPAPTPLLDPPQLTKGDGLQAAAATADPPQDPPQTNKEKRQERREERKEKRDPPAAEKPTLPSPYAKTPTADTTAPAPVAKAGDLATIKKFYALTVAQWEKVTDFEARFVKHEVMNGKETPTEEMLFRFRKSPLSVYMKTVSEHGKGREVLYVDKPGAQIHVVTGQGDQVLMRPGLYLHLDPDRPLIAGKSRQKISEAGFGKGIEQVGKLIGLAEKGKFDGFKVIGETKRKEYPYPLQGLEITMKPGEDPGLPKGGRREVYVDPKVDSPSYGLPVVVRAFDQSGKEVEYYAFDQFKLPANLTDADFSPDRLNKRRER
jgi:Protein of unknown function (DUF1571)